MCCSLTSHTLRIFKKLSIYFYVFLTFCFQLIRCKTEGYQQTFSTWWFQVSCRMCLHWTTQEMYVHNYYKKSCNKIKRSINFSYLFLEQDSTCFGQFLCPSPGVQHCKHSNGICHTGHVDCLLAGSMLAQCQTTDDGQRYGPKHVQFYSKNKFEKFMLLVGFIIGIYHDARSSECQMNKVCSG